MKTFDLPELSRLKLTKATPRDDGSGHTDSGADEQAQLEAGISSSLAAAGVKPKRGAREPVVPAEWEGFSRARDAQAEQPAPCGQINNGTACDMPRKGDERVCPDCNPRPQPKEGA